VGHDFGRDEFEVVEVVDVEDLQVEALDAVFAEGADAVDDLRGGSGESVLAQFCRLAAATSAAE
jgi:hypothetical protein